MLPSPLPPITAKGLFALNVQAAAGAEFKLHFLSAVAARSCKGSVAFYACRLARHLSDDFSLPDGFWVAVDDPYVAGRRFLTPLPGPKFP